jgi:hypothetical protein
MEQEFQFTTLELFTCILDQEFQFYQTVFIYHVYTEIKFMWHFLGKCGYTSV